MAKKARLRAFSYVFWNRASARKSGALAHKVRALARKVGASARKSGALAHKVRALARKVGASARKVGALARRLGASARKVGALARGFGKPQKTYENARKRAFLAIAVCFPV